LDDGIFALMIPIVALLIPIVVILTNHQRKMAEIIHQGHQNTSSNADLEAIRMELQNLRMQMNQHTIALDDIRSRQALPPISQSNVQERFGA